MAEQTTSNDSSYVVLERSDNRYSEKAGRFRTANRLTARADLGRC